MHQRPTLLFALLAPVLLAVDARAADWVFRPSYYSHAGSPGYTMGIAPRSRSAYREPYLNPAPQFSISGGWRDNNFILYNGNGSDRTYFREDWYQLKPPY